MQALKLMLFTMLIAVSMSIFSQNSAYFEHRWYGFYEDYSDVFEGGTYYMTYEMYDVVYDNAYNTFTATMNGKINIDGYNYVAIWKVNGSMSADFSVYLNYNYTVSSDQLPSGLYWIYDNLTGTIYENELHPGYYIIKGGKPGSSCKFEIGTYQ